MQINTHPLAQGSHRLSEVYNKKCQFHLSSCLCPTQRRMSGLKNTPHVRAGLILALVVSCDFLFLEEKSVAKSSSWALAERLRGSRSRPRSRLPLKMSTCFTLLATHWTPWPWSALSERYPQGKRWSRLSSLGCYFLKCILLNAGPAGC